MPPPPAVCRGPYHSALQRTAEIFAGSTDRCQLPLLAKAYFVLLRHPPLALLLSLVVKEEPGHLDHQFVGANLEPGIPARPVALSPAGWGALDANLHVLRRLTRTPTSQIPKPEFVKRPEPRLPRATSRVIPGFPATYAERP